ncbi:MAG: hypothetical protein GTN78_22375, partial [Gemmatimonadales bacterium]|nr:hypothetical protein [Gemmatimonadales bacterium]NIR02913.1 hypothetical protein [Gemmatimonadales bacterium]
SGKIGSRNTVASIYAADELPTTDTASGAAYAHFPVLRYKRALSEDSYVGGIYTGRELSNHFNRVLGVDGLFRLTESSTGGFHGMLSRTKADAGSPAVSGHSFGIHYTRGTRNVDYSLVAKEISRDFQVETGFITRTGLLQFSGLLRPKFYPNSRVVRRIDAELFTAQSRDAFSGRWETFNHISFLHYLWGSLLFKLKYSYSTEIFLGQRFQTGGYHVYGGGQFTNRLFFSVLYRNVKAIFYSADPYQGRSNRLTADLVIQPSDKLRSEVNLTYYDFSRQSDAEKIYDYAIARGKVTYQLSKYLFFRGILEYNDYRRQLLADLLASFTYIPGTVIHVGYGSLREKIRWQNGEYVESDQFLETKRRFFFKASYLWRI